MKKIPHFSADEIFAFGIQKTISALKKADCVIINGKKNKIL